MHVEHEAADRHRRQRAITDEVVPVAIAKLRHVELERGEQILGMPRRKRPLGERVAQPDRDSVVVVLAGETCVEPIEQIELLLRRQRGMIGDIVGGAHKIVERQDGAAVARMNQEGGDREILVPVSLSRPPIRNIRSLDVGRVGVTYAGIVHCNSETLAWARPFHMPPRPRAC